MFCTMPAATGRRTCPSTRRKDGRTSPWQRRRCVERQTNAFFCDSSIFCPCLLNLHETHLSPLFFLSLCDISFSHCVSASSPQLTRVQPHRYFASPYILVFATTAATVWYCAQPQIRYGRMLGRINQQIQPKAAA